MLANKISEWGARDGGSCLICILMMISMMVTMIMDKVMNMVMIMMMMMMVMMLGGGVFDQELEYYSMSR